MILGAGPYMVMAARFLLRMKLTGAELDAASELLTALKAREQVPDTFEKVLGHPVSGTGMCSLRQKVYSSSGANSAFRYDLCTECCAAQALGYLTIKQARTPCL